MVDTGENNADLKAHEATWAGFTSMMTWGTVAVALIAAFVVFLIAS